MPICLPCSSWINFIPDVLLIVVTTTKLSNFIVSSEVTHLDVGYGHRQWRHNERHGVSNRRHLDCLLSPLFMRTSKKTSKLPSVSIEKGIHQRSMDSPSKGTVTGQCIPLMTSSWLMLLCSGNDVSQVHQFLLIVAQSQHALHRHVSQELCQRSGFVIFCEYGLDYFISMSKILRLPQCRSSKLAEYEYIHAHVYTMSTLGESALTEITLSATKPLTRFVENTAVSSRPFMCFTFLCSHA